MKQYLKAIGNYFSSGKIIPLLFSRQGTIGRLAFLGGLVLLYLVMCAIDGANVFVDLFLLLTIVYCIIALVQKRCRSFNSKGSGYFWCLFLAWMAHECSTGVEFKYYPVIKSLCYAGLGLGIVTIVSLICRPSKKNIDKNKTAFAGRFPITTIILSAILISAPVYAIKTYLPDTQSWSFRLGLAVGEIHRHTHAYPAFCRDQGYEMKQYPAKVREKYKEAIDIIEHDQMELLKRNPKNDYKDIEDFYQRSDWGSKYGDAEDFFEKLRQRLIVLEVAHEKKIDPDDVVLTEEDDARITLQNACETFDADADYFVSKDCPFSYILDYINKPANCPRYM